MGTEKSGQRRWGHPSRGNSLSDVNSLGSRLVVIWVVTLIGHFLM